jgi:hypothetical protein
MVLKTKMDKALLNCFLFALYLPLDRSAASSNIQSVVQYSESDISQYPSLIGASYA